MTATSYTHQTCRVRSRANGNPTTISIERATYIRACKHLRDVRAVEVLIRKLAATLDYDPGRPFTEQVEKELRGFLSRAGA